MRLPRTLRTRLVLALIATTVVGLALMGFVSITLLEHSLTGRIDDQLRKMSHPWEQGQRPPPTRGPDRGAPGGLPTEFRVLLFSQSGQQNGIIGQSAQRGGPVLRNPLQGPRVRTVPDTADGAPWRIRTTMLPNGDIIAVAQSLASAQATVNRLVVIELIVGAAVLALLAAAAAGSVRLSLRPLSRIEETADAIAAGELQRRIPQRDERSEVGRLGTALNTMLTRLIDALRQRERSEQRMRRFIADASHELRTPLTSISGFAQLYRQGGPRGPDDTRKLMDRIESEALRMGTLVDDLLLLARLDRERTVETSDTDLAALASEVVHDAQARVPDRDITLHGSDRRLSALADGPRVRQVLTNLLNNALLHTTDETSVSVHVARGVARRGALAAAGVDLPAGDPAAVIAVVDSGPGISTEHAERIFDRFYRTDDARSQHGSGLGLAIAAAIVQAHNGRLELHRSPQGGSTFRLLLPLC